MFGATLVFAYVATWVAFRLLFNYEFLQGTPVYLASAPQGALNGVEALVLIVTALATGGEAGMGQADVAAVGRAEQLVEVVRIDEVGGRHSTLEQGVVVEDTAGLVATGEPEVEKGRRKASGFPWLNRVSADKAANRAHIRPSRGVRPY